MHYLLKEMYGNKCLSYSQGFNWLKPYKKRRGVIGNNSQTDCLYTSKTDTNIQTVYENIWKNSSLNIWAVAKMANIDQETVQQNLYKNLNMEKSVLKEGAETLYL